MASCRFSVLVPVFRAAPFIGEALEAVFSQVSDEMEVLIFDDASDDGTIAVIDRMVADHGRGRVLVVRHPVQMGPSNFYEMMARANSDIFIWCHGDDIPMPGRFEKIAACFDDQETQLVSSNAIVIDEDGRETGLYAPDDDDAVIDNPAYFLNTLHRKTMLGASFAARRQLFEAFPFDRRMVLFEDMILPFRAALLGKHRYLSEPLLKWRIHGANIHLVVGARNSDAPTRETYQSLEVISLMARRKDLDLVLQARGETEPLCQVRSNLDGMIAERLDRWLLDRAQLLWEGWRPTWQVPAPSRATAVRYCVVPLGQIIETRAGAAGAALLSPAAGWNEPEDWGTWSRASASITLHLPKEAEHGAQIFLEINGLTEDLSQHLAIQCGSHVLWSGHLPTKRTRVRIAVPGAVMPGRILNVLLRVTPGIRPCDIQGAGFPDTRVLGLALFSLVARPWQPEATGLPILASRSWWRRLSSYRCSA